MKEKATVDKAYSRPKKATMPTLLKFQNGRMAAISKGNTQFSRILCGKNNTKGAMVVANGQVYHGTVGTSEGDELTDTYICVRNKATNKVRIIPIEQSLLNNHIYNSVEKARLENISEENSKKILLKQFGGRKASRYVSNQENMKMNIDIIKDELDNTVREATITQATTDKVDTESYFTSIRPNFNKDAKKVHEIYDVNDVVPTDLLERLEEEAKVVSSTPIEKLPITSEYLRKCIETLQKTTPQSVESFLQIKLVIYMDCLLNLIKSRVRSLKKVELSGITEKVENDVRARFSDPNTNTRTVFSSEKAFCYFIVLALLISENYQLDINVLGQELGAPKKKVVRFAHIVNARLKASSNILALRLPSTMPQMAATSYSKKAKK